MAAILRQKAHHTLAMWRGREHFFSQLNQGMILVASLREPDLGFSQDTREPPTLCDNCHGICNDHSESGPRFNVSSERRHFLQQCPRHCTGALGFI
uniref:Uncharacterized protein n=1 Tax=Anguilla anguilla TaxID=7936 RepID=A0A0E9X5J3_ANGAN